MLVGDAAKVPLVAFAPLHPPEPVHEVALVEDQVTIKTLPKVILVGLAEIATVGAGALLLEVPGCATAGEASTKGESAIIEASALASRAPAL